MNVLLIIFNRPKLTERVFEQIRQARPEKIFIAADGPRINRPGEDKLCEESRKIVTMVDWPCDIKTNFQERNLGCKIHVSTAINWFFENVDDGIILEDDCLPNSSFFKFCNKMLERYRYDMRVMHVSGANLLNSFTDSDASYFFSEISIIWGWATWKRAWNLYDINMSGIMSLSQNKTLPEILKDKRYLNFWTNHFKHIMKKNVDTWDAQWQYSIFSNNGIVITPFLNTVRNIGFGPDATHTVNKISRLE